MTGQVRALEAGDIPLLADLHRRVFSGAGRASAPMRTADLARIFLHHPWPDATLPSLVYQDQGRAIGCVGVVPRPMTFNGSRITAAVSHSFVIEPGNRSTLAGIQLAQRFFDGPQDLSLAEGNEMSRKIWERSGGVHSPLYSLRWTRPLRPGRYALSFLSRRGLPPAAAWGLRPLFHLADAVMPLIPQRTFRARGPALAASDLDAEALCASVAELTRRRALQPVYDQCSMSWLLQTMRAAERYGDLRSAVLRNDAGETVGWYIYYRNPRCIADVVQLGAREGCVDEVLDHLFHAAGRDGVMAVSGQVDPAFFGAYAMRDCVFHHDGASWVLIHSRQPEILDAILQGRAFLTRLETEWWISTYFG